MRHAVRFPGPPVGRQRKDRVLSDEVRSDVVLVQVCEDRNERGQQTQLISYLQRDGILGRLSKEDLAFYDRIAQRVRDLMQDSHPDATIATLAGSIGWIGKRRPF
jgi:hypothetical protein